MKEIEFAGKLRPVKYGMNALRMLGDGRGITLTDLSEMLEDMSIKQMVDVVFIGLKDGARIDGSSFEMTRENIADELDKDFTKVGEFSTCLIETFSKILGAGEGQNEKLTNQENTKE